MRIFASVVISVVAFASLALAQLQITEAPTLAVGGKQYTIKYSGGDGSPTTITLRKGPTNDLKTITILTQGATGGSFIWNVDPGLVTGNDYALQVTEGTETNYWAVSVSGVAAPATSSTNNMAPSGTSSHTSPSSSMTTSMTSSAPYSTGTGATTPYKGSSNTTHTGSATSSTSARKPAPSPNSANNLQGPAALMLGVMAAFAYLG